MHSVRLPRLVFSILFAFWVALPQMSSRLGQAAANSETFAADPVTLAPIVVEGSSADLLLFDPIVPTRDQRVNQPNPSGSVVRETETELAVPMTDYGTPGVTTQVRGLGRTVEDTNVQTLGIPLNPAYGLGFDYSSFPQFFWSRYRFFLGPSSGGFDPRATTSTLSLTPWTADALKLKENHFRLTQTVTRGLSQTSVAGHFDPVAILVGVSAINAQGPTGSVSAALLRSDQWEIRAHLLATSLDVISPGSVTSPTPQARTKTKRWISILEVSATPAPGWLVRSSLFYDRGSNRYPNPQSGSGSYNRSSQFGDELAILWKDWTWGGSARRASFTQLGFSAPDEWIGHLQGGKIFRLSKKWTADATVRADAVSRIGWKPGASTGVRFDALPDLGFFARGNDSYRFATIADRYFQDPNFVPNPDLRQERALSFNPGVEWKRPEFESTLQGYLQFRSNAQLRVTLDSANYVDTVQNSGNVQMESLLHDLKAHHTPWVDAVSSLRWSYSHVAQTGLRVPYDAEWTEILGVRVHDRAEARVWSVGLDLRSESRTDVSPGGPTRPGFGFWIADADYRLGGGDLWVQGRVDDLTNRRPQFILDYPLPGRLYSLSLVGTF